MWWLIYEKCDGCTEDTCYSCKRTERSLRLKRIFVDGTTRPANALYGPRADFRELLDPSWHLFEFNEQSDELFFNFEGKPKR